MARSGIVERPCTVGRTHSANDVERNDGELLVRPADAARPQVAGHRTGEAQFFVSSVIAPTLVANPPPPTPGRLVDRMKVLAASSGRAATFSQNRGQVPSISRYCSTFDR